MTAPFPISALNRKVDPEAVRRSAERHDILDKYAIPWGIFYSGDSTDTSEPLMYDYEEEAKSLIMHDKPLPKELEQKLLDTLQERQKRNSRREANSESSSWTNAEIKQATGVDFVKRTYKGIPFKQLFKSKARTKK